MKFLMEHVEIGKIEAGVWLEDDQVWVPAFVNCLVLSPQKRFGFLIVRRQKHGLNNKAGK